MSNLSPWVLYFFLCWTAYKLITFLIYLRLTRKLKDGDLGTFTDQLGDEYGYKLLMNGVRRCKWKKPFLTIKANFDNEDKLDYKQLKPFNLFNMFTEITFV